MRGEGIGEVVREIPGTMEMYHIMIILIVIIGRSKIKKKKI